MKTKTETKRYDVRIDFQSVWINGLEAKDEDEAIEIAEDRWNNDSSYPDVDNVEVESDDSEEKEEWRSW